MKATEKKNPFQLPDQTVGVFIDTQNMYHSGRNLFGKRVNFGNIVKDATGNRKLLRAISYMVRTKTGEENAFVEALQNLGIEIREKELMEFQSGAKKADWDVGMAVDAIRMSDMLNVIVLITGDSDFIPLVEYLQSRGRLVEVMSFRETTATKLIEAADFFTDLSKNKRRYLIGGANYPRTPRQK